MSLLNFVPEIWSGEALVAFKKAHVFGGLVNRNYEGEVRNKGDVVRINTPGAITVNDYSGTVSYETPTSTQQSLVIDQDKYWAFAFDDLDKVQANVDLVREYMQEAGYSMADTLDKNIAALYTEAGLSDTAITLSSGDLYATMVTAGRKLDDKNVPSEGRWVVMSPQGYAKLLATTQFIHATASGDSVVRTGQVGQIAGFTVYKSNNLTLDTTRRYVYGTNSAITLAMQFSVSESVRREAAFEDGIRARVVFGRKVVRPDALGVITATEA